MTVSDICREAKIASNRFMGVTSAEKNDILYAIREKLIANESELLRINAIDVAMATENGKNSAFLDRLTLTHERIVTMCDGVSAVALLPDAVGEVTEHTTLSNGLQVERVRSPLGVVGIIYEARPNVTVDAAVLCIKSGNGVVLRGSKDATNSNRFLADLMKSVLEEKGFGSTLVGFIEGSDRSLTSDMLSENKYIDVVIPRGGEGLKNFVLQYAKMPVIASAGGNCHVYIDVTADTEKALPVLLNSKIQRPSVCNAAETLLLDRALPTDRKAVYLEALRSGGVELRGTSEVQNDFDFVKIIDDEEFYTEYCALVMKVKYVADEDEAIAHINKYGTHHSESILTTSDKNADRFTKEVDSAAVYVNASTRFTDGFQLGLGAEMGISTQKLHVRGPIGLKELTSVKFVVHGNGQVRQ